MNNLISAHMQMNQFITEEIAIPLKIRIIHRLEKVLPDIITDIIDVECLKLNAEIGAKQRVLKDLPIKIHFDQTDKEGL